MKTKQYKIGQKIYLQTKEDSFYYTLQMDDIECIKSGEWEQWGWKILLDPAPKNKSLLTKLLSKWKALKD